jgi:hypothetical protein
MLTVAYTVKHLQFSEPVMTGWPDTVNHIRGVLFEEEGTWSAQLLDYDLAAQSQTLPDLQDEIIRAITVHIAACMQLGRVPFAGFKPAPQRFWDLYEEAAPIESRAVPFTLARGAALPPIRPELRVARADKSTSAGSSAG